MASGSDLTAALGAVALFSGLTNRQLRKVADLGTLVDHPADHVITREGATGHGFHIVLSGSVEVSVGGEAKKATLGSGAYFGEMALLDGGPRSATVTATSPVRELVIDSSDFRRLVETDPGIASELLRAISTRLREAERSLQA